MRLLLLALTVSLLAACARPHKLRIGVEDHWVDDSAVSARSAERRYRRIMVLPPSGTARGVFEGQLAAIEAEFLRRGLAVYTPAVTARAIVPDLDKDRDFQGSQALSDIERALILAKESDAEALLQIGALEWRPDALKIHFVYDGRRLVRVDEDGYAAHAGWRRRFALADMAFTGRLIDVATGEVMVAFRIRDDLQSVLEEPYIEEWVFPGWFSGGAPWRRSTSFALTESWIDAARRRVSERFYSRIAEHIAGTDDVEPDPVVGD